MWLIFGGRTKARPVSGGRVEERQCWDCGRRTKFRECDVTDKFTVFFVELAQTTQRRLVCTECGEDLALDSVERQPLPAARPVREAKRPVGDREIDDRLANLKNKMGMG